MTVFDFCSSLDFSVSDVKCFNILSCCDIWSNDACIGYVKLALDRLNYDQLIPGVISALYGVMHEYTVDEAAALAHKKLY